MATSAKSNVPSKTKSVLACDEYRALPEARLSPTAADLMLWAQRAALKEIVAAQKVATAPTKPAEATAVAPVRPAKAANKC
jgi:hypothetical protein